VNRMSQGLVLLLLGGAVLRISAFSTSYLNYVKPGFRPFLIAAGAVVFILGAIILVQEWRKPAKEGPDEEHGEEHAHHDDGHGHDHAHGPRVAWLMTLPVFAIFLIAPPALGSYAAARDDVAPPPPAREVVEGYAPLPDGQAVAMPIGEFVGRAWGDPKRSLTGKRVRLTGFVVKGKKKDTWYVARMQLNCCAADALALKVAVKGAPAPAENTWVEVTGTWIPPKSDKLPNGTVPPEIESVSVVEVPQPTEPYE
jgi:uncharacterized repeat protein (TIGR03943 family)